MPIEKIKTGQKQESEIFTDGAYERLCAACSDSDRLADLSKSLDGYFESISDVLNSSQISTGFSAAYPIFERWYDITSDDVKPIDVHNLDRQGYGIGGIDYEDIRCAFVIMAIKFFIDNENEEMIDKLLLYLACDIYTSTIRRYFPIFPPVPGLMDATMRNLCKESSPFKQENTIRDALLSIMREATSDLIKRFDTLDDYDIFNVLLSAYSVRIDFAVRRVAESYIGTANEIIAKQLT